MGGDTPSGPNLELVIQSEAKDLQLHFAILSAFAVIRGYHHFGLGCCGKSRAMNQSRRPIDLGDEVERRRLGPAGLKACRRIMRIWHASEETSRMLLGVTPGTNLDSLDAERMGEEQMLRISYLLDLQGAAHLLGRRACRQMGRAAKHRPNVRRPVAASPYCGRRPRRTSESTQAARRLVRGTLTRNGDQPDLIAGILQTPVESLIQPCRVQKWVRGRPK